MLGVVGLGRIGREVARARAGLRMDVLGYDPYVSAAAADQGIALRCRSTSCSPRADFVTLHLPLSAETRHLHRRRARSRG